MGLIRCRHTCGIEHRGLGLDIWPQLTGSISIDNTTKILEFQPISLQTLQFRHPNVLNNDEFWTVNSNRFMSQCNAKRPSVASEKISFYTNDLSLASVMIDIVVQSEVVALRIGVNESYRIRVSSLDANNTITVRIEANTIFGARHGIETLSQMIIYDDLRDVFLLRCNVALEDGPVYAHRGIMLDTARNFYPVEAIKRTIGKKRRI